MKEEAFETCNMDERNSTEKLLDSVKRFNFYDENETGVREENNGDYVLYDDYIAMEKHGLSQTDFIELRSINTDLEQQVNSKWVSGNLPPKSNIEVIVLLKNSGLWWGVWNGDIWLVRCGNGWTEEANVTHWMPTPDIPKETKRNKMKPSEQCKAVGLKGLKELAELSGEKERTLINKIKSKPLSFNTTLHGAALKKFINSLKDLK